MSKTRFAFGLTVLLATTGWLLVRPGPPMAQAGQGGPLPQAIPFDAFSEDEAAHRYASSQPRHWRHLLIKK